ncbi:hypothetical protein DFJ73DRAFT_340338 [Zopfochytrium polystomum]|nr:hypothetical protein DFJ73DRAFT_340338 [Zopfochytrium polystomum]
MHAESVPSSPPAGTISGPTPTTTSTNQSDPRAALRRRSSRRPSLPPPSPSSASFSPFAGLADPAFAPMLNSSPPLEFASSAAYSFSVGGSSGAVDDDDAETVTNSVTGSSQDLAALLPQLQKYLVQQQQQQQQQLQQMQGTARPVRRVSFDLPQEQLADFDHLGGGSDGTWTSVVGNALKSGLKAYILATGVKGTVAFLAAFARRRSLQHALSTVLQSESVRRTSNAVGAFTFAYKLITTLPLAASSPIESRLRRINATSAFLGGAVAGLAVFLESAANRKFVMDQLAVRSLHAVFLSGAASATSFSKARYAAAKMDVGLLAVVGAVLMYAFAVEPKLLPESVYSVMKRIVGIPEDILNLGRATVQANPVTLDAMSDAITRHGGRNMATSLVTARQFFYYSLTAARDASHVTLDGSTLAVLPALPCSVVHAHDASCTAFSMGSGIGAFTAAVPVVASVSVVPSILGSSPAVDAPGASYSHSDRRGKSEDPAAAEYVGGCWNCSDGGCGDKRRDGCCDDEICHRRGRFGPPFAKGVGSRRRQRMK